MGSAFDLRRADFSGMTSSGSKDLYISGVFHKAFVDVNEQGTEAAAATAVAIGLKSAPITRPFTPTFRADRPFIYLIRDSRSGSILFLGRMLQP
jgi:serpin B